MMGDHGRYRIVFSCVLLGILLLGGCWPSRSTGTLTYAGPTEEAVAMGQALPGTNIRYVGYSTEGAEVLIGDQKTIKKVGDSLDWRGTPVSGVEVVLTQRILSANAQRLQTVGTAQVTVQNVEPAAGQYPDKPTYAYKVAVTYTVKKGDTIPGTLITYKGKTENGAELAGVSGYPFRKLGDSISWTGRLRGNTYLDSTLRVIAYADDFMQVGGLANIGLAD